MTNATLFSIGRSITNLYYPKYRLKKHLLGTSLMPYNMPIFHKLLIYISFKKT